MSNANDAEFAQIAEELIYEFGVTVVWSPPKGTSWSIGGSSDESSGGTGSGVFMTPRLNDDRSLSKFQNRIDGDSIAFVEPRRLLSSGVRFEPEPGMVLSFPGDSKSSIVAFDRIYSGEDVAVYMLYLRD